MSERVNVEGIHPTAVVDASVRIGEGVSVGPYCIVGPGVEIGPGCVLRAHVTVEGPTVLGADNVIYPMAYVGGPPQDRTYRGEPTRLVVGSRNKIREFTTLQRATTKEGGVTVIGDDNFFMAYAHVAHDCRIGNGIILANAATLAGHVEIADGAVVGAFSGVHQFCRVGREAYIGGYSVVTQDALPWVLTVGNRAESHGINVVGLKRSGYGNDVIEAIKRCYKTLFRSKLRLAEALDHMEAELGHIAEIRYFIDFVRSSRRGVCR